MQSAANVVRMCVVATITVLAFSVCAADVPRNRTEAGDLEARFAKAVASAHDDLIALRRDLHRHPELSGSEVRTARVVAERLRRAGLRVRTDVGGHGIVATLTGGRPGPVVAFRADMDAVTSQAPDSVSFASVNPGVRHICGHDLHTTIGVALAEGLATLRNDLPGTVQFFFQPAEEAATGARAMLADGALGEPRPQAIFAYHVAPMALGQLATSAGTLMPARDRVRLTIADAGDSRAILDEASALLASVGTLTRSQSVTSVTGDFALVEVENPRKTSEGWSVGATITVSGPAARAQVRKKLESGRKALSQSARVTFDYVESFIAGVTNDRELAKQASISAARVTGVDSVRMLQSMVPAFSEDFGSFQAEIPGVMLFLGVSNSAKGIEGMPHTPNFVADEDAIGLGARVMSAVLLDALTREPSASSR